MTPGFFNPEGQKAPIFLYRL